MSCASACCHQKKGRRWACSSPSRQIFLVFSRCLPSREVSPTGKRSPLGHSLHSFPAWCPRIKESPISSSCGSEILRRSHWKRDGRPFILSLQQQQSLQGEHRNSTALPHLSTCQDEQESSRQVLLQRTLFYKPPWLHASSEPRPLASSLGPGGKPGAKALYRAT